MIFHHLGVATANLGAARRIYESLGFSATDPVLDPVQQVEICFMSCAGHPLIELIAPTNESSPVQEWLGKVGASPYHTAYEVPDLEAAIARLQAARFILVREPVPAVAFAQRRICFLYQPAVGLVELIERQP